MYGCTTEKSYLLGELAPSGSHTRCSRYLLQPESLMLEPIQASVHCPDAPPGSVWTVCWTQLTVMSLQTGFMSL